MGRRQLNTTRQLHLRLPSRSDHDPAPRILVMQGGDWTRILGVRRRHCETMHDLRKAIREARYALEALMAVQESTSRPTSSTSIHATALKVCERVRSQ